MSDVVAALVRDALVQTAAVTALVSTRVYASYRPNVSNLPAIIVSYGDDRDLNPSLARTDCLRKMQVTVDCIGSTLKESRQLAEVCRKALHGSKGTYRSVTVIEIRANTTSTEYDLGADANDMQVHITTVQVECTYRAPAVTPTTITDPGAVP